MKYKLDKVDTKKHEGMITYRVIYSEEFAEKHGIDRLGGYVESEKNLSQSGDARITENAHVYEDARVGGNAWVSGNAHVYGDARVSGDAGVSGNAHVCGDARVIGDAQVSEDAQVFENALVGGNARVTEDAQVYGDAYVYGDARVYGNAHVFGNAHVYENVLVSGDARVYGNMILRRSSKISSREDIVNLVYHKHDVTITKENVAIGCLDYPISEWIRGKAEEHGKYEGYTSEEIEFMIDFLRLLEPRFT